jgi:hypothetical protein
MKLLSVIGNIAGLVRTDTMEGEEYLVAPMVMLTEGVLNGSEGALLYPAEEMRKFPESWNHKPVVVYHPTINGAGVSACDPEILSTRKVGVIMHTRFEEVDGKGKLIAEAWLKRNRLEEVDPRILEAIENKTVLELSTGLFAEAESSSGEFKEVAYNAIARNYRPDHLAILPDQKGASSIEDGSGFLRLNSLKKMSYDSLKSEVSAALQAVQNPGNLKDRFLYVVDLYDSFVIFEDNNVLYKVGYAVSNDTVQIDGTPEKVVRWYEYVVVNGERKIHSTHYEKLMENTMDKTKVVNELIGNGGRWSEGDREFLMNQSDDTLAYLRAQPGIPAPKVNEEPSEDAVDDEVPVTNVAAVKKPVKKATVESWISNAPADVQEVLRDSIETRNSLRNRLVEKITANEQNKFTKDQLVKMNTDTLKGIAALCDNEGEDEDVDFSPLGEVHNAANDETPLDMPSTM